MAERRPAEPAAGTAPPEPAAAEPPEPATAAVPPEPAADAAAAAGTKKLNRGGGPEQKNVQRQKTKENEENKQEQNKENEQEEQNKQKEQNKQNKENKQEEQNKQNKENKQEDQNKQNKENKQDEQNKQNKESKQEEQNKQNKENKQEEQNKQNIKIRGGDVFDCFSSSDLDLFFSFFDLELKFLKSKVVSSKCFYDFRTNSISKDDFLKETCNFEDFNFIFVPLHISFHWVFSVFCKINGAVVVFVFDSAPNFCNFQQIKRIFQTKLDIKSVFFIQTAKQIRFSNECGVFVVFFFLSFLLGFDLSSLFGCL